MSTIPAGTSGHSSLGNTAFVGMTDLNLTGTWDRPFGCVTSYTNWQSGRPSTTKTNQKFVVMQQDGQWIDSDATGLETQCTCQYALPPPTRNPTMTPTKVPTTMQPTKVPTFRPSRDPTRRPTAIPSVYDAEAPIVAIASDNSVTSLNTEVKVTYTGTVTAKEPCFAIWTVDSVAPTLESVVTTVTRVDAGANSKVVNLVLAPYTLPVRATLMFTFTCGTSATAIVVTTNGPPLPGVLTVLPSTGVEVTTTFLFEASGWSDTDLPLKYAFSFVSPTSGALQSLQDKSLTNKTAAGLPAGTAAAQNQVRTVVVVYDSLEANSNTTSVVTVTKQTSAVALQSSILSLLSSSSGDATATKSAISVGAAALNSVSCAHAPDCTALHRLGCAKVQDTCGACLVGYIGTAGDSNSACLSPADIQLSASTVKTCEKNSDCNSWEECDLTAASPVCALPTKACPDACSNHGTCARININTQKPALDCKTNNPTCEAVCTCSAGYTGSNCATTAAELVAKQAVRTQLISSLTGLTSSDEASSDSVVSWSNSLAALTQDPYELSAIAAAAASDVSLSIVNGAQSTASVTFESIAGVLASVDAVAFASANAVPVGEKMLETVSLFADLVTSQRVSGESSVEYIYDSFRSASVRQFAAPSAGLKVSTPQTFAELSANIPAASASLALTGDTEEEVAVSLVSTAASSYGANGTAFNSNPLRLQVSRASTDATKVTLVLHNHEAQEYTNETIADSLMLNSTCTGVEDTSVYYFPCPLSDKVLKHNCTGLSGIMTSYCPIKAPSCSVKDPSTGAFVAENSVCSVVSFDAYSTTCECVLASAPANRRLSNDALDQSGVLDLVTATTFLGNQFADTFMASGQFDSPEAFQRVLTVIVMFSTLWACGLALIVGCAWRRKVMEKKNSKDLSKLERKMQSAQVSRSPAAVRQYLADYVRETLPSVFSSKPFFSRMYGEVKRHHRYLKLITAPNGQSGDKERVLTAVELLSIQTMLMFLLALLYDMQGPSDDGSCAYKLDPTECTRRVSPFDSSQSYCDWATSENGDSSCVYQSPKFTLQVMIYIGVMVALLVALISYPVDRLFELLNAPDVDEMKAINDPSLMKRAANHAQHVVRRVSVVANNIADAAQTSTRKIFAGSETRKLPESTEAAHALASASMTVIAANSQQFLMNRQLSRVRSYYASGGKFGASTTSKKGLSYDSDSDDSNSESDSDKSVGSTNVRSAQKTNCVDRTSSDNSNNSLGVSEISISSQPSADDVMTTFSNLEEQVLCQRRLLKPSELELFDFQWGMDPNGDFTRSDRSVIPCVKGKPGSQELILKELRYVKTEAAKRTEKLRNATDQHTGLEILHLFIIDLLGRNTSAARIFEIKSAEDFKHTKVVTKWAKRMAVVAIIALNAFFVYYAMLTGYQRGVSWQRVYLFACIAQFFVEIFLFETMECVWVNCAVPVLVSAEVQQVSESIVAVVQELCAGNAVAADPKYFLNAPDYLFVSTNVAKKFPSLMESILVQAYSSHVPGELAKTWQVGSIARIQRHHRLRRTTLLGLTMGTLQFMGTAPFIVHRMFVRAVQPFVLSGLVLLWNFVVASTASVVVTVILLLIILAAAAYMRHRDRTAMATQRIEIQFDKDVEFSAVPDEVDTPDVGELHKPKKAFSKQSAEEKLTESSAHRGGDSPRRTRYVSFDQLGEEDAQSEDEEEQDAKEFHPRSNAESKDESESHTADTRSSIASLVTIDSTVKVRRHRRPQRFRVQSSQSETDESSLPIHYFAGASIENITEEGCESDSSSDFTTDSCNVVVRK
uniref:PKD/REJ-like domain-containing protein n=1 Tax=Spumella elongata TaxID=89044 RepID=A0A7S3M5U4_9STRA